MRKPQLYLFHFAGGSSYSYQFIKPYLSDFDVITLELPGRGGRVTENLLTNFEGASNDLFRQVVSNLNGSPFLIFGHSMGAYLALKVAGMLEKENRSPQLIIVSGNPGPGITPKKNLWELPDEEFIKELTKLGGIPPKLLEDSDLLDFFTPIFKADFQIVDDNNLESYPPLNCPIYSVMGDAEETVASITNWQKFTNYNFDFEILEGNHFFIYNNPQKVAEIIKRRYAQGH